MAGVTTEHRPREALARGKQSGARARPPDADAGVDDRLALAGRGTDSGCGSTAGSKTPGG